VTGGDPKWYHFILATKQAPPVSRHAGIVRVNIHVQRGVTLVMVHGVAPHLLSPPGGAFSGNECGIIGNKKGRSGL
jgi:hypothetical protein